MKRSNANLAVAPVRNLILLFAIILQVTSGSTYAQDVNDQSTDETISNVQAVKSFLVSPTSVEFRDTQIGVNNGPIVANITNASTDPIVVNLTGGGTASPFLTSQNCQGLTLQPGESCQFFFRFQPTADGNFSATSNFGVNGEAHSVSMNGAGIPPQIHVAKTHIEFGQATVFTTSDAQLVDVTNVGLDDVVVSMAGGGTGSPFSVSQNCQGLTLAPGDSCQLFLRFSPSSPGPAEATSNFAINGTAFAVSMAGVGIPIGTPPSQLFVVSPTEIDFGEHEIGATYAPIIINIRNIQNTSQIVSMAGGGVASPFSVSQNCQGLTLAPGAACQLFTRFVPTQDVASAGVSNFTLNGESFAVDMSGAGVHPHIKFTASALDMGQVVIPTRAMVQTIDAVNVGRKRVTVSMAGGGVSGPFSVSQNCQGLELEPGERCQLFFNFEPTATGLFDRTSTGSLNGRPFSIYMVGEGLSDVLPVELASFDVVANGSELNFRWKTLSEVNLAGFVIESLQAGEWASLSSLVPATSPNGGDYSWMYSDAGHGSSTFRLASVDSDGTVEYSSNVEFSVPISNSYDVSQFYPNPFHDRATVTVAVNRSQTIRARLYNLLGQMVFESNPVEVDASIAVPLTISANALSPGTYFLHVEGETFREVRAVVLSR